MEANSILIQQLKDINAVILDPNRSVMERYAGISELDLFPDWRKVDIFTLGLFDSNSKVRELAAQILDGTFYGLGESSYALLKLFENNSESLKDAIDNPQQKFFLDLLSKIKPLLRKKGHYVGGLHVDCYRKHGVIILRELGRKFREIEGVEEGAVTHPLKRLLQAEDNNWILKQIKKCLKSEEVYCRRNALLLIGELDLKFDLYDKSAFNLILDILNLPENRNDYLVTKDGIKALTALVQQNCDHFGRFCEVIRDFFNNRHYSTEDGRSEEYRYYTLHHCVVALGELIGYQDSSVLIEKLNELIENGKSGKFLDIMRFDRKYKDKVQKASSGAKRTFIEVLTKIYQHESKLKNDQLTEIQRDLQNVILDIIRQWVGSKTASVRASAISFFADLPDVCQALGYLLQTALNNNQSVKRLLSNLQVENSNEEELYKTIDDLLATRQDIVTVISQLTIKVFEEYPKFIEEKGNELSQLLQEWCWQKIEDKNREELENSSNVRLLALWTLYNLNARSQHIHSLNLKDTEENKKNWTEETRNSFRSVLELFRARNSGEEFLKELRLIATGNDDELVQVCAKIEWLIQTQDYLEYDDDLSDSEVEYISKHIRPTKHNPIPLIHSSLTERFIPVLSQLNKPNATQLIKQLLSGKSPELNLSTIQLRESLSDYHCYELHNYILKRLFQNLAQQYKKNDELRLGYLNLLRAGEYKRQKSQEEKQQKLEIKNSSAVNPKPDLSEKEQQELSLKNRVLEALNSIEKDFETLPLPLLERELRIAALESLSPQRNNTVLYATEAKEIGEEQVVNVYLQHLKGTNSKQDWSRQVSTPDPPKEEYFAELLVKKGTEEFDIVYLDKKDEGYVFEIEQGRKFCVPAVRLVKFNEQDFQFILPSNKIKPGYRFKKVKFIEHKIKLPSGKVKTEVVLKASTPEKPEKDVWANLREGMKIVAQLEELNRSDGTGKVRPSERKHPQLCSELYLIKKLSINDQAGGIEEGSWVSGKIENLDREKKQFTLVYDVAATSSKFEVGQVYPCRVAEQPEQKDDGLKLRYNNRITGFLPERYMTYGHTSVLSHYKKGDVLEARLVKKGNPKNRYEGTVTFKNQQTLAKLDIQGQKSTKDGEVIRTEGKIVFEGSDRQPFEFSLEDLDFGSQERPRITLGDLIEFKRTPKGHICLSVKYCSFTFSILPSLNRNDEQWEVWDKVLEPGKHLRCVFIKRQGSYYVFEAKPGVVFDLPTDCLNDSKSWHSYELHRGDALTLFRHESEDVVQLEKFEPSLLNWAAQPGKFDASQSYQPPIPILGKVTNIQHSGGRILELVELAPVSENGVPILLRSGITGLYRWTQMSYQQEQDFKNNKIQEGDKVWVTLNEPPKINEKGQLQLTFLSSNSPEDTQPTLQEKLEELEIDIRENREKTFLGTIERYDRKNDRFLVTLDALSGYDQCKCWLPRKEISFNLVRAYQSLRAFGQELGKQFTLLSVNWKSDSPELTLSLKQNPKWDIDNQASIYEWSNGKPLKQAAFLGIIETIELPSQPSDFQSQTGENFEETPTEPTVTFEDSGVEGTDTPSEITNSISQNNENSEGNLVESALALEETVVDGTDTPSKITELATQSDDDFEESPAKLATDILKIIGVEIEPGEIIKVPADRFFVYGKPYHSQRQDTRLQIGDEMELRVIEDGDQFSLEVVKIVPSEIHRLSNKRRILLGLVGKPVGDKVRLEIAGYDNYPCFVEPKSPQERENLAQYDLFKWERTDIGNQELYFKPVLPRDLEPGDFLRITYEEQDQTDNGIVVTFGKHNRYQGYIPKSEISYRSDFVLSDLTAEPGELFEAMVLEKEPNSSNVKFTIKGVAPKFFDDFLNSIGTEKIDNLFADTVLARKPLNKNCLDLEIEPGTIIRIDFHKIEHKTEIDLKLSKIKQKFPDDLIPGDRLQFKLLHKPQKTVKLRLVGIVKSLPHYLKEGMLVLARYREDESRNKFKYSLPEYGDLEAILEDERHRPNIQYPERLVIKRIPTTPNQRIQLRTPTMKDRELVLRVQSIIGGRIYVQRLDRQPDYINSSEATYRVNNHITYLKEQLPIDEAIVGTKNEDGKLSLRNNKPIPFIFLQRYLPLGYQTSQELELTFVRSQGDDNIFEIKPGQLVIIPTAKLSFYDHPWQDFQHFSQGDIFTVRIERLSELVPDQFRVVILGIRLSVLHDLQLRPLIEAKVQEKVPGGQGIVIKANHLELEQFIPKDDLLQNSTNPFTEGDSLWMKVQYKVQYFDRKQSKPFKLVELQCLSSLQDVLNANPDKRQLLYGKIAPEQRDKDKVKFEILGKPITVALSQFDWSDGIASSVNDVLLPQERGMWVSVFSPPEKYVVVDPKALRSNMVNYQLKKGQVVQAQVLQVNKDEQGNSPKSILLDVYGVRTLVPNTDIAWGVPSNLPSVEPGTWLPVHIEKSDKSCLLVSARKVSSALDNMSAGNCFKATVRYTLPHGLVFSYQEALGYIHNEQLTWSGEAKAQDMFEPGEQIDVYKVAECDHQYPFGLKHPSQIAGFKSGDEVEAKVIRKTKAGMYVLAKSVRAFVSRKQLGYEPKGNSIILQLEYVQLQQLKACFFPLKEGGNRPNKTLATKEKIRQTFESYYMTSVKNLKTKLTDSNIASFLAKDYLNLGVYDKALALYPNHSDAWWHKGEIERKSKQYEKAIEFYSKAIEANEEWCDKSLADAYHHRGLANFHLKNYQAATDDFNQALKNNFDYIDTYYFRGLAHFYLETYEAAIDDFNQTLKKDSDYAYAYYFRGLAHFHIENYSAAVDDFNQTLTRKSDYVLAYYYRGLAHFHLEIYKAAIDDFNQTLKKNPNYAKTYYDRGRTHIQLKSYQAAINDLYEAVRREINHANVYYNLGVAHAQLGNNQAAIQEFNQVLQRNSQRADALYERGMARLQLKDYQDALKDFDEVIRLKRNDHPEAYYHRGLVRCQLGDYQEALQDFNKAIQLKSDYAEAYDCWGDIRSHLGEKDAAVRDWDQAAKIFLEQGKRNDCKRVLDKIEALEQ